MAGYLPQTHRIVYDIIDLDKNSSITINIEQKKGELDFFGYMCENVNSCDFEKPKVQLNRKMSYKLN